MTGKLIAMDVIEFTKGHYGDATVLAGRLRDWFGDTGVANMAKDLKHQRGYAAVDGERLMGFLSWFVNEGSVYIGWIAVDPDEHRRGIGRALVERLMQTTRSLGISRIRVWTLSQAVDYPPYENTRAFYRAMGFRWWHRVPGYCDDGSEMEVYQRELNG